MPNLFPEDCASKEELLQALEGIFTKFKDAIEQDKPFILAGMLDTLGDEHYMAVGLGHFVTIGLFASNVNKQIEYLNSIDMAKPTFEA